MAQFLRIVAICWAALLSGGLNAQLPPAVALGLVELSSDAQTLDVSSRFAVFIDPSHKKTIADVRTLPPQAWEQATSMQRARNEHTLWLALTLKPPADGAAAEWFLDVEPPWMDHITLHTVHGQGKLVSVASGDTQPFASRSVAHGSFAFLLKPGSVGQTYWLQVRSSGTVWVRATLSQPPQFAGNASRLAHGHGFAMGLLLLLTVLVIMQGVAFKDRLYALFAVYCASNLLLLAASNGLLAQYVAPNWPAFSDAMSPSSTCLGLAAYGLFCRYFLLHGGANRVLNSFFLGCAAAGALGAVLTLFSTLRPTLPAFILIKMLCAVVAAACTVHLLRQGSWTDRLLWVGVLANVVAQSLLLQGLAQDRQVSSWLSIHTYVAPTVIHMLLLSFALSQRAGLVAAERRSLTQSLATQAQVQLVTQQLASDQRSFLAMLAHELRGPLSAARMAQFNLGQLLAQHPDAQVHTRLSRTENSIAQMSALIEVCLLHEREAGAPALSMQHQIGWADLHTQTQGLLGEPAQLRLRWQEAPPNTSALVGNVALVAIALRNLIDNACRYDTSGNAVEVTVSASNQLPGTRSGTHQAPADTQQGWLRLQVADRGPGLPEQSAELFAPFKRGGDDRADRPEGLGLGLYIVQRIAHMHGGQVEASNRDGGGAVFTLTLPAA